MRALLIALALTTSLQAQTWTRNERGIMRELVYNGDATILKVETPITVTFYNTPERTTDSVGAIGFTLEIRNHDAIRQFHWDDFEGPDAPAQKRKLLEAQTKTFKRKATTGGWLSVGGGFAIGVSTPFDARSSMPRELLRSLSRTNEETLRIVVTDMRDAKVKLTLDVPVAGRRADFAWLIRQVSGGLPKPR